MPKVLAIVCDAYVYALIEIATMAYFILSGLLALEKRMKLKEHVDSIFVERPGAGAAVNMALELVCTTAATYTFAYAACISWISKKLGRNLLYQFCVATVLPFVVGVGGADVASKTLMEITGREPMSFTEQSKVRGLVHDYESRNKAPLAFPQPPKQKPAEKAPPPKMPPSRKASGSNRGKAGERKKDAKKEENEDPPEGRLVARARGSGFKVVSNSFRLLRIGFPRVWEQEGKQQGEKE